MEYLKALAESGVWLAVYPLGVLAMAMCGAQARRLRFHPLLAAAVGSAIATVAMMLLAQAGAFVPAAIGAAGWAVIALWFWRERIGSRGADAFAWVSRRLRARAAATLAVAAIVAVGGALYAFFPKESLLGERDEGIYAQHALLLLRTGSSTIDVAALGMSGDPSIQAIYRKDAPPFPGLYPTGTRWTLQFTGAGPVWMASLAAVLGPQGIFRFNAILGVLVCLAFYALIGRLLPARGRAWAIPAAALFALQPSYVWISRNTLSELLCTWFLFNGLLMASIAAARRSQSLGLLAGALIGMACFVRIDAVVFPLAIAVAALAQSALDRNRLHPRTAAALQQVGVGCYLVTALAIGYFLAFAQPYLIDLSELVLAALVATALCAFVAGCSERHPGLRLRGPRAAQWAWPAALAVAALFVYALWIRPHMQPYALIESRHAPHLSNHRDYREISLAAVAAYLSLPATLAAGIGAVLIARAAMSRRLSPIRAWLWAFLLLPTLVYLWKPMISPDHIWASRRWIPAIFPTAIALAAFAAARLGRSLPRPALPAAALIVALAAGAHSLWQQRDTLRLREDAGMLAQVAAMAERLPQDRVSYVVGAPSIAGALLAGFGRPVAQPAPDTDNDPARFCPPTGDCWILHPKGLTIAVAGAQVVADLPLRRLRRQTAFEPLAHGTRQDDSEWRITRIAR